MKIFLDARLFGRSGIGRYIEGLYRELMRANPRWEVVAAGNAALLARTFFRNQRIIPFDAPIYSWREQIEGWFTTRKLAAKMDLFHFPHYNAPWILPDRSVISVHDLIQYIYPEFFNSGKRFAGRLLLQRGLRRARKILVDSECTARDLVRFFPHSEMKIRVVRLGIAPHFHPLPAAAVSAFKQERNLGDYILYVGTLKSHKNLARLLRAFADARGCFPDLQLVLIGDPLTLSDKADEGRRPELPVESIREIRHVTDEELNKYYCGARLLVHPSLYEGFGFPALEAMAAGTPVAVSRTSSLPEVCGEAALYFDPCDVSDMAEKIRQGLADEGARNSLVERGLRQVRAFTWERCALETARVFEEAIHSKQVPE